MSNDRELVLVAARKSRGSNHWDKDDYDVRCGPIEGPVVGRIFRSTVAPTTTPWFWTIIKLKPLKPTERGYAITREVAMSALMQASPQRDRVEAAVGHPLRRGGCFHVRCLQILHPAVISRP